MAVITTGPDGPAYAVPPEHLATQDPHLHAYLQALHAAVNRLLPTGAAADPGAAVPPSASPSSATVTGPEAGATYTTAERDLLNQLRTALPALAGDVNAAVLALNDGSADVAGKLNGLRESLKGAKLLA